MYFQEYLLYSSCFDIVIGSGIGTTIAGSTGTAGATYSQFNNPYYIHVDTNRTMFILDTSNYRVLKWQLGEPLGYVVAGGNGNGGGLNQIGGSYAMFIDSQSNIYVSDSGNDRVTFWSATNKTAGILVCLYIFRMFWLHI